MGIARVDYMQGKMKVAEYITHRRTLGELNAGFADMHVCLPVPSRRVILPLTPTRSLGRRLHSLRG